MVPTEVPVGYSYNVSLVPKLIYIHGLTMFLIHGLMSVQVRHNNPAKHRSPAIWSSFGTILVGNHVIIRPHNVFCALSRGLFLRGQDKPGVAALSAS